MVGASIFCAVTGSCTWSVTHPGRVVNWPFRITARLPEIDNGTIVKPCFERQQKAPRLEPMDDSTRAARAFRINDERRTLGHQPTLAAMDASAIGLQAIHEQMTAAPEVPSNHRHRA